MVNICIATVFNQGCDVKNFEINRIFLVKLFFYMARKIIQKYKYLKDEKSF